MRWLLVPILMFAAGNVSAQAPKALKTDYETSWFAPDGPADAEAVAWVGGGFNFSGNFHVWYLLGEPVVNCAARWTNSAQASATVRTGGSQSRIERAREGEVEVYNLMLAATAPDPRGGEGRRIVVFCDAGVVAQNGRDGFNVAGSPSWDRFICAVDRGYSDISIRLPDDDLCKAVGGNWLDSAGAKSVAIAGLDSRKVGLTGVEVKVLKAEVSGMAVMKRVEKRLWREKSAAFKHNRAAAYFADFPQRPGEDSASWSVRRTEAMRSLPDLPQKDPSAEQLKAYEAAWQAMLASNSFDAVLEQEWRAKEKALVAEQLDHLKMRDRAAATGEANFRRYLAELERRKENEPGNPDPMAQYRTATLVPFSTGGGRCGLKRADGTMVVPAQSYGGSAGCPEQLVESFGLYAGYYFANWDSGSEACGNAGCMLFFDDNGNLLYKGAEGRPACNRNEFLNLGLVCASGGADGGYVYSILKQKLLFDRSRYASLFPQSSDSTDIDVGSPRLRNGEAALLFSAEDLERDLGCGAPVKMAVGTTPSKAYAYLYLDSERIEHGVCTPPGEDPLNEEIE